MKGVFVKPLENQEEVKQLDRWRREYWDGDLELPHDFRTPDLHVDTAVATKEGKMIASLTAIDSVVFDPFIKDPQASPTDLLFALVKLDTALAYQAQRKGAVDAYIAVPSHLTKYIHLLQNYGWQPTVQNCVVLRRPLRPDTIPLLGPERDLVRAEAERIKTEEEEKGKIEESD